MGRGGETGVWKYGKSKIGSSSALVKADLSYSSALNGVTPSVCEQEARNDLVHRYSAANVQQFRDGPQ